MCEFLLKDLFFDIRCVSAHCLCLDQSQGGVILVVGLQKLIPFAALVTNVCGICGTYNW